MKVALFLTWHDAARPRLRVAEADVARSAALARSAAATRALLFTPARADDPLLANEAPPPLALQLYFDDIAALEQACEPKGALQALVADGALPSLAGVPVGQQAMLARPFPVPQGEPRRTDRTAYVVAYEGPAVDLNAWLTHYIGHHPRLMARLPGIREIEVCTRIDWYGALPAGREDFMLRNRVEFDSPGALSQALQSPVRQEMRSDYGCFPPFSGKVFHYPMATCELL